MILSKATGYGIRALGYLANRPGSTPCPLQEIALHEEIPPIYLQKILGELRRHRLLRSVRGIHGGYELGRPATDITLWEIYSLLDPNPCLDSCILGRVHCTQEDSCALHGEWLRMRDDLFGLLQRTTVRQMADTLLGKKNEQLSRQLRGLL